MDKDHELASKVDALLGKHGADKPGSHAHDVLDDRNIPVLNDFVDTPSWSPTHAPLMGTAHATATVTTAHAPSILDGMSDNEIDRLSHDIFTRVFDRLDGEFGVRLEERLNDRLAVQINAVVSQVYGDLRQELANEIGDAINAALADKLRRN
jgi:hypothetical protein